MLTEEKVRRFIEASLPDAENDAHRTIRERIDALGIEHEEIFRSQINILRTLLRLSRASSVLELGTFLGYSTATFVEHVSTLRPKGNVITVDRDSWRINEARSLLEQFQLHHHIDFRVGDAIELCRSFVSDNTTFDFIFLDTFEATYAELLPLCVRLMSDHGVILVDNILMRTVNGWASQDNVIERSDNVFEALRRTIEIASQTGMNACIIPSGSGLLLLSRNVA